MTEQELMQEGMDFRLFVLRFVRKIWIAALAGLAGALLFGGGYLLRHVVYAPARQYEAVSRYYITFAQDRGKDYYNDYTWNDLAASDPILDYTMSLLPEGYDKKEVQQSVTAKIYSDVRVLTTIVTTNDSQETLEIARATEQSVCHFGEIIPEIAKIEVIMHAEAAPVILDLYTGRAALLGLTGGALLGIFIILFLTVMDSSVYLEEDAERRLGLSVLGSFYRGELEETGDDGKAGNEEGEVTAAGRQLLANLKYLAHGEQRIVPLGGGKRAADQAAARLQALDPEGSFTAGESCLEETEEYNRCRSADGVLLLVRCGAHNSCLAARAAAQLRKQNCKITGILLYDADRKLADLYYLGRHRKEM